MHLFKKHLLSSVGKRSACNAGDPDLIPGQGRSPGEGERLPTPVFWPEGFHGLNSPRGHKVLEATERLSLSHIVDTEMPCTQYGGRVQMN